MVDKNLVYSTRKYKNCQGHRPNTILLICPFLHWFSTWGNSLAFLNTEGTGGAASPQILRDGVIPSNKEFAIFSSDKCNGDCGFVRAPDVSHSK